MYSYESEPTYETETVRISSKETYNGKPIYTKDIKVRIYNKLFPLLIKLEKAVTNTYDIVVRGQNPMKLGLNVSATCTVQGENKNIPGFERYDYISNGKRTDRTVNINGRGFAQINNISTPSDLSRIDFSVQGVNEGTQGAVAYPKLQDTALDFYFGNDYPRSGKNVDHFYGAWLGPGKDLYPGNDNIEQPDNVVNKASDPNYFRFYNIHNTQIYINGEVTKEITNDGEHIWQPYKIEWESIPARYNSTIMDMTNDNYIPDGTSNSNLDARLPKGINCASSFDIVKKQKEQIDSKADGYAPFYIINGGMTCVRVYIRHLADLGNWNNKKDAIVYQLDLLGPGRDLFTTSGTLHKYTYICQQWTNFWGQVVTNFKEHSYKGDNYMTINGCSSWPGADETKLGYFTDEY